MNLLPLFYTLTDKVKNEYDKHISHINCLKKIKIQKIKITERSYALKETEFGKKKTHYISVSV